MKILLSCEFINLKCIVIYSIGLNNVLVHFYLYVCTLKFSLYKIQLINFSYLCIQISYILINYILQQEYDNSYVVFQTDISQLKNYVCGSQLNSSQYTIQLKEATDNSVDCSSSSAAIQRAIRLTNFTQNNSLDIKFTQDICGFNASNNDIIKGVTYRISDISQIINTNGISYAQQTAHFEIYQNQTMNADLTSITSNNIKLSYQANFSQYFDASVINLKANLNVTSFDIYVTKDMERYPNLYIRIQNYKDYCHQDTDSSISQCQVTSSNILNIQSDGQASGNNVVSYYTNETFSIQGLTCDGLCYNNNYSISLKPQNTQIGYLTTINGILTILNDQQYRIYITYDGQGEDGNYSILLGSNLDYYEKTYKIQFNDYENLTTDTMRLLQDVNHIFVDQTGINFRSNNDYVCSTDMNDPQLNKTNFDVCNKNRWSPEPIKNQSTQNVQLVKNTCFIYNFTLDLGYILDSDQINGVYDQQLDQINVTIDNIASQRIDLVQLYQQQYYLDTNGVTQNLNRNVPCFISTTSVTGLLYTCQAENLGGQNDIVIQINLIDSCSASKTININKTIQLTLSSQSWSSRWYQQVNANTDITNINFNNINNIFNRVNYQYSVASVYNSIISKMYVNQSSEQRIEWNSDCNQFINRTEQILAFQLNLNRSNSYQQCVIIVQANWGVYLYNVNISLSNLLDLDKNCNVTNTGYEIAQQNVTSDQYYQLYCQDDSGLRIDNSYLKIRDQTSKNYQQNGNQTLAITYCTDQYGCYDGQKELNLSTNINIINSSLAGLQSLTPQQLFAYATKLSKTFNQADYTLLLKLFEIDKINFPYYYEFITQVQDKNVRNDMYKYGCIYSVKTLINLQLNKEGFNNVNQICQQAKNDDILTNVLVNTLKNTGVSEQFSGQISKNTQYFNGPIDVDFQGIKLVLNSNQSLVISQSYGITWCILSYYGDLKQNKIQVQLPTKTGKHANIKQVTEIINDNVVYQLFQSKKTYRNCELTDKSLNMYQCQIQGEKSIIFTNYNTIYPTATYIFMAFSLLGFIMSIIGIVELCTAK